MIKAWSVNSCIRRSALSMKAASPGAAALVEQQAVGLDGGGHREGQAQLHAGRVDANGALKEAAQVGERGDPLHARLDLGPGHAQKQAALHDVLVAGDFGVHAERDVEERRNLAVDLHRPDARLVDAGQHPQQRGLARAVVTDQADAVAVS